MTTLKSKMIVWNLLSKIKIFELGAIFKKEGEGLRLAIAVGYAKKIKGGTPETEIEKVFKEICEKLKINPSSVIADLIGNPSPHCHPRNYFSRNNYRGSKLICI